MGGLLTQNKLQFYSDLFKNYFLLLHKNIQRIAAYSRIQEHIMFIHKSLRVLRAFFQIQFAYQNNQSPHQPIEQLEVPSQQ